MAGGDERVRGRGASKVANRSTPRRSTRLTREAAQDQLVMHVEAGLTITAALDKVGRSRSAYEEWRRTDPDFKRRVEHAKALQGRNRTGEKRGERLPFAEFRRKYLGTETFWHQHQWIDILEGREPRDLHPAQTYVKGRPGRVLINVPPFHSKSVTVTLDYVVYRLCMDPGFRVIIVSESSTFAESFLQGIKQRLTHPDYEALQRAYAPDGGWRQSAESWTQKQIIVGSADRDSAEKDPNVQVLGIRGQIYGRRCDMVIVDDAVTGSNVNEFEKQLSWIRKEVASRIEAGGKLLVIGTRMASVDLYSELLNGDNYGNGKSPWTYFAAPAILEEAADPKDHVTLWPVSDMPWQPAESDVVCDLCDGSCSEPIGENEHGKLIYPRWDGIHIEAGPRAENSISDFALVYQQSVMDSEMTFPEHAVRKACENRRLPGVLKDDGSAGHPIGGMHGMYVVAGCDPSIKGFAGIVIVAFDPKTGMRYLLNAYNLKAPKPDELRDEMKRATVHYGVHEWRVEKTGLLQFFTQDEAFRLWFANRGVQFREHNTNRATKWDQAFGVASLSQLFGAYERETDDQGRDAGTWRQIAPPLIELPHPRQGVRDLVHQLIKWTPDQDPKRVPQDLLMALWFVDVRCRELAVRSNPTRSNVGRSRFAVRGNQKKRTVVNLADYRSNAG